MPDADPDPLDSFNRQAEKAGACPEFVGLTQSQAAELAEQNHRLSDIRVLERDERAPNFWHMDRRPNRLNLVVRDGIVIAGALF